MSNSKQKPRLSWRDHSYPIVEITKERARLHTEEQKKLRKLDMGDDKQAYCFTNAWCMYAKGRTTKFGLSIHCARFNKTVALYQVGHKPACLAKCVAEPHYFERAEDEDQNG